MKLHICVGQVEENLTTIRKVVFFDGHNSNNSFSIIIKYYILEIPTGIYLLCSYNYLYFLLCSR